MRWPVCLQLLLLVLQQPCESGHPRIEGVEDGYLVTRAFQLWGCSIGAYLHLGTPAVQ